jgi:hypothetical protein
MVVHTGGGRFEAIAANTIVAPREKPKKKRKPKVGVKNYVTMLEEMKKARVDRDADRVLALYGGIKRHLELVHGKGTTRNAEYQKEVVECRNWARQHKRNKQRQLQREMMRSPGRA